MTASVIDRVQDVAAVVDATCDEGVDKASVETVACNTIHVVLNRQLSDDSMRCSHCDVTNDQPNSSEYKTSENVTCNLHVRYKNNYSSYGSKCYHV